jgi:hypothetical protein
MCQLRTLFEMQEKIKIFAPFFNRHFRELFLEYSSNRVVGTYQTCYR